MGYRRYSLLCALVLTLARFHDRSCFSVKQTALYFYFKKLQGPLDVLVGYTIPCSKKAQATLMKLSLDILLLCLTSSVVYSHLHSVVIHIHCYLYTTYKSRDF